MRPPSTPTSSVESTTLWPWVALGLCVAALVVGVAALLVTHAFDGLYGQDSFFYQAYAVGPLRDAILGLRLPPDFTWPPGFPALVAVASLPLGTGALPGQAVSLVAGAAVPVFTYLVARDVGIYREKTRERVLGPLLAAALVALTPHLWQSSAVVMSDTAGLAFGTAGAWMLARYAREGRLLWALGAAAVVAIAVEIRWVYGLVAIPLAVAGLVVAWRNGVGRGRPAATVGTVMAAAGIVALFLAPMVVPMALAAARGETLPFAIELRSHTWDPTNAFRSSFYGPDGLFSFAQPMAAFYLIESAQGYYLTPLFAILGLVGALAVVRRASVVSVAVLLAWPLLVIGFLIGDTTQNTRFSLAVLPPIAVLASLGVASVTRAAGRLGPDRGRLARTGIGVAVVIGLAVMGVSAWRFTDAFIVRQQSDLAAIDQLAADVPADARLISFGATLKLRHDGYDAIELYDLSPDQALALVGDSRPTYLLIPADILGTQWADAPPGRAFRALAGGAGLREVARSGAWILDVTGR